MQAPPSMKKLHFRMTKITFERKMCVIGLNEKVLGLNTFVGDWPTFLDAVLVFVQ